MAIPPSQRRLEPGEVGPAVDLSAVVLRTLVPETVRRVLGAQPQVDEVVWTEGGDELAIRLADVALRVDDGFALFEQAVRCDETGPTRVGVAFAVGSEKRPAGMFAAAPDRPFGPRVVVDRWGGALTALGWSVLLDITHRTAAASGEDVDGEPLVPVSLTAGDRGLSVVPFARHRIGRPVR